MNICRTAGLRRTMLSGLAVIAAGAVAGFGPDRPQVDDAQALTPLFPQGFAAPLAYPVALSAGRVGADGQLNPGRDNYVGLAVEAGYLSVTPDPAQSPWWRLERGASPLIDGGHIALPIGARAETGQADTRTWTEGGRPHFAETVTYVIRKNPRLTMIPGDQFGPFSVRLVLAKDPKSGRWETTMGTAVLRADEAGAISRAIDPAMAGANARLASAIADARAKAFAAIEQGLKDGGVLEHDPADASVLLSRKMGVAYFIRSNSFRTTTLGGLMRYCAREAPARHGPWRLASEAELKAVIGGPTGDALLDAPDHRLWGTLGTPTNSVGWDVIIPTSDLTIGDGSRQLSAYAPTPVLSDPGVVLYRLKAGGSLVPGGSAVIGSGRTARERILQASFGINGKDDMRVVCTASLRK